MRWRLTLWATALIPIGGLLLIILLALGAADPPDAGPLVWQTKQPADWTQIIHGPDLILDHAPVALPTVFTLELSAQDVGTGDSAWGIALLGDTRLTILIDNRGYFSVAEPPEWTELRHIHPDTANTLYLNVDDSGLAILRINQEIAWKGEGIQAETWGVVYFQGPELRWQGIQLFGR